jgi:NAD(P)-dependent dehydrogenase (short-subunit alcohol dehydrogenase family)
MLLAGRTAFVTGGAGRLGRVIAATLQREGAAVVISDLSEERIATVLAGLARNATREPHAVHGDVSQPSEVARMVEEAEQAAGPVDILVNAHGIIPSCPILEMTAEQWDAPFAVNVRGLMLTCQAFARRWIVRKTAGAIVNVSSGAARAARIGRLHYGASKAAVNALTESMSMEFGPHGIRVNVVVRGTPLGRTGSPQEIAEAVAFLASEGSSWTTGLIMEISGGAHCARRVNVPSDPRPLTR